MAYPIRPDPTRSDPIRADPSEWSERCGKSIIDNPEAFQQYLGSLDLWVVSHGGVGSNALHNYFEQNTNITIRVKTRDDLHGGTCHLANPDIVSQIRDDNVPTLVIFGDILSSMASQSRRSILTMNTAKMRCGDATMKQSLKWNLEAFPEDPAAFIMMQRTYQRLDNVVIIKAPYTNAAIVRALEILGFQNA